ncbi:MAG TPA: alpha/beta hydrolase [Deltaproteobacteria bacterium]|nr:alpha/beta hydrolase [Deltaproteobacteria bacterium]
MRKTFHQSEYLRRVSSQFTKIKDFDIHYIHQGEGEPVILIHGGGMWLYSYRHNLPELAKHFSVYALDMPGSGYTQCLTDNPSYSIDAMADAMTGFMVNLNIPHASLVGHSWGGGWAIHFAQKYPDQVKSLILIDSSGLDVKDVMEWELLKYPILGNILVRLISEDMVRKRLERSFYQRDRVTCDMVKEVYTPMTFTENRKALLLLCRNQDWGLTEKSLDRISKPILLVWGDKDLYLDPRLANQFMKRCLHIKPAMIEQCGHSPHEEYPETVNRLIMDFLKTGR